jgi:hypothetical protein
MKNTSKLWLAIAALTVPSVLAAVQVQSEDAVDANAQLMLADALANSTLLKEGTMARYQAALRLQQLAKGLSIDPQLCDDGSPHDMQRDLELLANAYGTNIYANFHTNAFVLTLRRHEPSDVFFGDKIYMIKVKTAGEGIGIIEEQIRSYPYRTGPASFIIDHDPGNPAAVKIEKASCAIQPLSVAGLFTADDYKKRH